MAVASPKQFSDIMFVTLLSVGIFGIIGNGVNGQCLSNIGNENTFSPGGAEHLPYDDNTGYQFILPDLQFKCRGKLTSWSALLVYKSFTFTELNFVVYVQVWRPLGGQYELVGSTKTLIMHEQLTPTNATQDDFLAIDVNAEIDPLYFQYGDIIGFYSPKKGTTNPFYITYRNATDLGMDMYYTTSLPWLCQMSECSDDTTIIPSIIPNIHFTYEMVSPDDPAFQQTRPALDCISRDTEECPTSSTPIQPPPSPSPSHSFTSPHPPASMMSVIPSSTSPSPVHTMFVETRQDNEGMPLLVIIVSVVGGMLILTVGGFFIVVVFLVFKRKNSSRNGGSTQCNASNSVYSEMNGVDEPTAYASTHRLKSGAHHTYLELERNTTDSPQSFVLHTGEGSAATLSSANSRPPLPPFSVSGPVRGGAASIQQILTPGAMSMQLPRTSGPGMTSVHGRETRGSSLRGVSTTQRPPIPPVLQQNDMRNNSRRGSVPLKTIRKESQQMLLPGKSMPAMHSLSPPPPHSPPTPRIFDPPVPYLTPNKPWYKCDYETANISVKPVPEEEGLYVPTMEERRSAGEDYSRLRHPHHSNCPDGDVVFFEEPEVYREPASSTSEIYQQLSSCKAREIIRKYITIHERLGAGHFAIVHRGTWRLPGGEQEVAVKELNCSAVEEDRVKFLQEAVIMGQFHHTNVVKLHGVVTFNEPLMIVMELMPNGDLKNYVNKFSNRSPQRHSSSSTPPSSPGTPVPIPPSLPAQLLSFCRQVADGMAYLSGKNFVHRDLAARNIFLTKHFACKIGDFGLARELGGGAVYQSRGGKVPIKWTAPEALQYRQYTSGSDVWSYGMVLFEIWSLGHKPFDACTVDKDVMELIRGTVCQPPPPGCPREIYNLMIHCWHNDPSYRPTFSAVCEYLNQSDSDLLKLPEDLPRSVSPEATRLGAPLAEAKGLYLDLQYCYDESIV